MNKRSLEITWLGSEVTFQKCSPLVCLRLQEEKFQWKRSDNEFPQPVQFLVEIVPFQMPFIRNPNVSTFPPKRIPALCHLFFVDISDQEKYKSEVRSQLAEWFSVLRDADTNDWLIVFDSTKARENKSKNVILEKLRSDFSKFTNKIVEIYSVQNKGVAVLIRNIVEILFVSLDCLVQSYELALKVERENWSFAQWSFTPYYLNQLQLAYIYSSLGLFDNALAQLEQVDLIMSFLISNFAASLLKPAWIGNMFRTFPVISVKITIQEIDNRLRSIFSVDQFDDISTLSHTEIRLLLLSYQLALVLQKQESNSDSSSKQQTAEIMLNYGFKCLAHLAEEKALIACHSDAVQSFSVVLWCVELLNLVETFFEIGQITSSIEAVCNIWMMICREIEFVRKTVEDGAPETLEDLNSKFFRFLPQTCSDCLCSIQTFDVQYVKWHETAIAMLKHMNWNRNAKMVCLALARFHSNRCNHKSAVQFYSKLLRSLRRENWTILYYSLLNEIDQDLMRSLLSRFDQINYLADLSCIEKDSQKRLAYFETFRNILCKPKDEDEDKLQLDVNLNWLTVTKLSILPESILCGSKFVWTIDIRCNFPADLPNVRSSYLCYNCYESEYDLHKHKFDSPVLNSRFDGANAELTSTNCGRSNYFKRKSDVIDPNRCNASSGQMCFQMSTLKFGINRICVEHKTDSCGVYRPDHLHFCFDSVSLILILEQNSLSNCFVENSKSILTLETVDQTSCLWVGVTQTLKLFIKIGSDVLEENCAENLTVSLKNLAGELSFPEGERNLFERKFSCPVLKVNDQWSTEVPVFVGLNGQPDDRHCKISVEFGGKTYEFEFLFKSLLAWSFQTHIVGCKSLVEFVVTNFSKNQILHIDLAQMELFSKDSLSSTSVEKIFAKKLNNLDLNLSPLCPFSIVWEMNNSEYYREGLVSFTYSFGDSNEIFECWAKLVFTELFIVEACCQVASESVVCRVDLPCDFVISLKADHKVLRCAELTVGVLADGKFWRCLEGAYSNVHLKENGLGQAALRLTPQCVGYLPLPAVDVRVMSPANVTCQVYCRSKGKQIHVLSAMARKGDSKSKILP